MTNAFTLQLYSATRSIITKDITSFVGTDQSGSFGIMANHQRLMTCLEYGLMQLRHVDGAIEYAAIPGGILYFVDNILTISTRYYFLSANDQEILTMLDKTAAAEQKNIEEIKTIFHELDRNLLRHLRAMKLMTK